MNYCGVTSAKRDRLGSYAYFRIVNFGEREERVWQLCANVERNSNRISRESSDDLSHVDLKSHAPSSTEKDQQQWRKRGCSFPNQKPLYEQLKAYRKSHKIAHQKRAKYCRQKRLPVSLPQGFKRSVAARLQSVTEAVPSCESFSLLEACS